MKDKFRKSKCGYYFSKKDCPNPFFGQGPFNEYKVPQTHGHCCKRR